jgi:fatty-acyl-CoA synthase
LSYASFREAARRFARGLHALGVRKGDKVAILMGNRPEWLIADFAILQLGAVMVSINTWATRRELEYMLSHSDTSVLITQDRFLGNDYLQILRAMEADGARPPGLREIVCLGGDAAPATRSFEAVSGLGDGIAEAEIEAAQTAIRGEDLAYILYTSGSTSTPKGVELQHYALIENMWHIGERQHLDSRDRFWCGVSLFWGFASENALFAVMTHGATVVLQEYFEAGEALRLIEAERCSVIYATPNMIRALAEHADRPGRDLSSLRTGATIGTPEQIDLVVELGAARICNVYGLTETYGNCAVSDAGEPIERRRQSVGKPLPGVDLRIVEPLTRAPLGPGEVGEIIVKGYVTTGYYKDADKNVATFDADGYFLTGDLGFLDADGFLYFRGRFKEMVKTGGINVAPIEVEEILMAHPTVEQAFVVGLPDPAREEILGAVIVARDGAEASEAALLVHCRELLAAYKVPRRFMFLRADELPLTSTGKVRKNRIPKLFEAAAKTSAA